jgi:hypothetical protein
MKECDDCGEATRRRTRCWHCGQFVCRYCWHHEHACAPGHTRGACEDLRRLNDLIRPLGQAAVREYLDRLRHLSLEAGQ